MITHFQNAVCMTHNVCVQIEDQERNTQNELQQRNFIRCKLIQLESFVSHVHT